MIAASVLLLAACGGHSVETVERVVPSGGAGGQAGSSAQMAEAQPVAEFIGSQARRFGVHGGYIAWSMATTQGGVATCRVEGKWADGPEKTTLYTGPGQDCLIGYVQVTDRFVSWTIRDEQQQSAIMLYDRATGAAQEIVRDSKIGAGLGRIGAHLLSDEGLVVQHAPAGDGVGAISRLDVSGTVLQSVPIKSGAPSVWTSEFLVYYDGLKGGYGLVSWKTQEESPLSGWPSQYKGGWIVPGDGEWVPITPLGKLLAASPDGLSDETGYYMIASPPELGGTWQSFQDFKLTRKFETARRFSGYPKVDDGWVYFSTEDTVWRIHSSVVRGGT